MTVKRYLALWYERDEYDQWIETSEHKTIDEAKTVAFKNASKGDCHLYAEVHESTLGRDCWEDTGEWINHHDTGNKWSGWITREKYEAAWT